MDSGCAASKEIVRPECLIPRPSERSLIDGKDRSPHTGYIDFERRPGKNAGYLVIVRGSEKFTISATPGWHQLVFYSDGDRAKLWKVVKLDKAILPRRCVSCGHGNVQHDGGGWKDKHVLRYQLYLIPEDMHMKDAVPFLYGDSTQSRMGSRRKVILRDVDAL